MMRRERREGSAGSNETLTIESKVMDFKAASFSTIRIRPTEEEAAETAGRAASVDAAAAEEAADPVSIISNVLSALTLIPPTALNAYIKFASGLVCHSNPIFDSDCKSELEAREILRGRAREAVGTESNAGARLGAEPVCNPASISGEDEEEAEEGGEEDEMSSDCCCDEDDREDGDDPCTIVPFVAAAAAAVAAFFPLVLEATAVVGVADAEVAAVVAPDAAAVMVTLTSPPHSGPSASAAEVPPASIALRSSSPSRHEPTTGVPICGAAAGASAASGNSGAVGSAGQCAAAESALSIQWRTSGGCAERRVAHASAAKQNDCRDETIASGACTARRSTHQGSVHT